MKAQDLAEKLLEYPRARVVLTGDSRWGEIESVEYNAHTNDLYLRGTEED